MYLNETVAEYFVKVKPARVLVSDWIAEKKMRKRLNV